MPITETDNEIFARKLFSDEADALPESVFSESAWLIIENSLIQADKLGHKKIGLSALLLSMIDQPGGNNGSGSVQKLTAKLQELFGIEETSRQLLELSRDFLTEEVQRILQSAHELAENANRPIEPEHLWAAVLVEAPHFLKQVFEKLPFPIDFEQVEEEAASEAEESSSTDNWTERLSPILRQALGAEDLTFLALSDALPATIEQVFAQGDVYEKIARSLYRSQAKHVVLTTGWLGSNCRSRS